MARESFPKLRRPVQATLLAVLLGGVSVAFCGAAPTGWLDALAERIGHAEDFTPDRLLRGRLIAIGMGAAWALLAFAGLTFGRHRLERAASAWGRDCAIRRRLFRARMRRVLSGGPLLSLLRTSWPLVLCLVVGAGLRIWHLNQPIKYDEAYTYLIFARRPLYQGMLDFHAPNNHLLHTLLSHVSLRLLGDSEWTLRVPAFLVGLLLIGAVYRFGKTTAGTAVGLLTTGMTAASAVWISYSTNARGYTLVCWLGLVFAYRMLCAMRRGRPVDWVLAGLAATLGFFAIPTMLYCFLAVLGWSSWQVAAGRSHLQGKAGFAALLLFTVVVGGATLTLYSPPLVFSGLEAFRHQILTPHRLDQIVGRLAEAWWAAVGSWSEGIAPAPLLGLLALVGLVANLWRWQTCRLGRQPHLLPRAALQAGGGAAPQPTQSGNRKSARDSQHTESRHAHAHRSMAPVDGAGIWLAMFLATAVVTVLSRQAPPPRVFTQLSPYFYLFVAAGLFALIRSAVRWMTFRPQFLSAAALYVAPILTLLVLVRGGVHVASGSIFGHLETGGCPAARPAVAWLSEHAPDADRILAPLGCDLPILYYLTRTQSTLPWMGRPSPGETVYLLAPSGVLPQQALIDPVHAPLVEGVRHGPWQPITKFPTGSLWKSVTERGATDP